MRHQIHPVSKLCIFHLTRLFWLLLHLLSFTCFRQNNSPQTSVFSVHIWSIWRKGSWGSKPWLLSQQRVLGHRIYDLCSWKSISWWNPTLGCNFMPANKGHFPWYAQWGLQLSFLDDELSSLNPVFVLLLCCCVVQINSFWWFCVPLDPLGFPKVP